MSGHLPRTTLEALLERRPGLGAQAAIHLLACSKCQLEFQALSRSRAGAMLDSLKDLVPLAELVERHGPEVVRETEEEFRRANARACWLAELPPHQRRQVIQADDIPPVPLAAGILRVLPGLIQDAPEEVEDLCRVGLEVMAPEGFEVNSKSRASLMAELEANLANALRVLGQLPSAEAHMDRALRLSDETSDPYLHGEVFLYASLLARDSRDFDSAFELAETSRRQFQLIGASEQEARLDRVEALISFFQGDFPTAIPSLERLAHDDTIDKANRLSATFFLVKALVLTGAEFNTGALLPQLNELAKSFAGQHLDIQLAWLKGLIVGRLRDPEAGEALMSRARDYYLEKQIVYDAALVTLDMAMVRFEAGHYDEAARHAAGIVEAFAASGIYREALVALRYFHEAVAKKEAQEAKKEARDRYKELQVFLPLSRRDPAYAYKPGMIG
jgi:tetratricopeptide (TPR) repeat protein